MQINWKEPQSLGALLGLVCAIALSFAFIALRPTDKSVSSAILELVYWAIPSAVVTLLAFPIVFFFLHKRQDIEKKSDTELQTDIASKYPRWQGTISWDSAYQAVDKLVDRIQDNDYKFDCIVSLSDGGLLVAELLLFSKKFRMGKDLSVPVISLNLRRLFTDHGKEILVDSTSFPLSYARQFQKLLVVDEASRSGKTMEIVIKCLRDIYESHELQVPQIKVACLGVLDGSSPFPVDFHGMTLKTGDSYPWGPFSEYWSNLSRN